MSMTTIQTVSLDNDLFNEIKNFKSAGDYRTDSEVLAELIRAGLDYLKEQAEDEYLLALALERKKNDAGVRISFEEHLAERGLTIEDIENMEDTELEYELPN